MKEDFLETSDLIGEATNYISVIADGENSLIDKEIGEELPILTLRNMVLLPGVAIPITVARSKSLSLIKKYDKLKRPIGVVAQMDASIEEPESKDLYKIGTVATILKLVTMPDGSTTALINGLSRFEIEEFTQVEPFFKAKIHKLVDIEPKKNDKGFKALLDNVKDTVNRIIRRSSRFSPEIMFALKNMPDPNTFINTLIYNFNIPVPEKQKLLEMADVAAKALRTSTLLNEELQMVELKNEIQDKTKSELDKQQRDYFLQQQLKSIQSELGDGNGRDISDLKEKAAKMKWNDEIKAVFEKELKKLNHIHAMSPEYSVQLNFLNTLVDLPWGEYTKDNLSLKNAQKILDKDHFGLEKVKERIIEYIAVLKLKDNMKSPILCLVGPPGVGKTSLGKSIAKSLDRKYVRMSLGGLRDEAEIRGHRKTYIGAMPGRVIQNLRKAKSANPVFVLDEIDKITSSSFNGDPQSAMLELLDPEQNSAFYDNFLEVGFDLSHVMFIATANSLKDIPTALRDRMEVIDVSGYILQEKLEIAKRHLIPKQLEEHGLKKGDVVFSDDIITTIIEGYTRESGVRNLERVIAKVIRSTARYIAEKEKYDKKITDKQLTKILGAPRFEVANGLENENHGVVTGLAWTAVGGDTLFIEAITCKGDGKLTMTGNLGDVMKESATIAHQYIKSHADDLGIDFKDIESQNIHIHVPEGATPKDGPSAGITMLTAITSAYLKRSVNVKLAMTGEITLRGQVLPVGGLKEKVLAAKRAYITDIVLSAKNKKDIDEINPEYLTGLNFHYVSTMMEVLNIALGALK